MNIQIKIKDNIISILLMDKNRILDKIVFKEKRNLSEKLLPSVDRLLKKNKIRARDIETMKTEADINDSYTTYRIAETVSKTFNWAVNKL